MVVPKPECAALILGKDFGLVLFCFLIEISSPSSPEMLTLWFWDGAWKSLSQALHVILIGRSKSGNQWAPSVTRHLAYVLETPGELFTPISARSLAKLKPSLGCGVQASVFLKLPGPYHLLPA